MAFMDLIHELRTGRPNRRRAARVLQGLGVGAVVVGLLNLGTTLVPGAPIHIDPLMGGALTLLTLAGVLVAIAGRALARGARWSIPLAQWTVSLAVLFMSVSLIAGFRQILGEKAHFVGRLDPPVAFKVMSTVAVTLLLLQFAIPAWFGVRYLGRLRDGMASGGEAGGSASDVAWPGDRKRRYAVLPLPVLAIFPLYILVGLLLLSTISLGADSQVALLIPAFLVFFFLPVLYNFVPSRFEKSRTPILTAIGGGSLYLLQGTWPFFRVLVYDDGVEVRCIFQRLFVPYAEAEEIRLEKAGILIRSDLPGVPSRIRFLSTSNEKIHTAIESHRSHAERTS